MKKRLISAILLASITLSLTACGGDKPNTGDDTTVDTVSATDELPAGIAKQEYKGVVNILMPDWGLYRNYFDPGDDLTDVMNKALFNREQKVEQYLDVDITYQHVPKIGDIFEPVTAAISTNDDLYQIVLSHCIQPNASLITGGYLTNLNDLGIDFTADWFNQKSNEALEVSGKQFFCISDYMIPDPNVVIFNSGMIEKNHLEDPYQLVRDGKWTLDKMTEMASVVTLDNGDGVWDNNDTYGFAAPTNWFLTSFIHGADVDILARNDEGEFELVFDTPKSYEFIDKMEALLLGPDTYIFDYRGLEANSAYTDGALTIDSDRCLFTLQSFNNFWSIRNIETEFGILPFPKFDEAQEDYYSLDWSGLMSVPLSVSEDSYQMVGDTIELLAYHSEEEVLPAYIEATLGTKFARDETWAEMIEIIFDGIVFDPTLSYFGNNSGQGTFQLLFVPHEMLVLKGENTFASWLATHIPPAQATIDDFNDAVKALD